MKIQGTVMMEMQVCDRGGAQRDFKIVSGRGMQPEQLVNLYNRVIDPQLEAGMMVSKAQITARLLKDPEALQIGIIDGWPVSFINLVKLRLESESEIPSTDQKLTQLGTFSRTDPNNGNYWFCPWVGVTPDLRGFKGVVDGIPRSLGQLHALNVRQLALDHGNVFRLFAYSRPAGLNAYVAKLVGSGLKFETLATIGDVRITILETGQVLVTDDIGIKYPKADEYLLTIADYWKMRGPEGKRLDPVFQFHSVNGASFRPDLVMPHGQIYDGSSLGFRTPLQYSLR